MQSQRVRAESHATVAPPRAELLLMAPVTRQGPGQSGWEMGTFENKWTENEKTVVELWRKALPMLPLTPLGGFAHSFWARELCTTHQTGRSPRCPWGRGRSLCSLLRAEALHGSRVFHRSTIFKVLLISVPPVTVFIYVF